MKPNEKRMQDLRRREIMEKVRRILEEEGSRTLEEAKREILREKVESGQIRAALRYQMSRWNDVTRPALISLACRAVGGDPERVSTFAKAMILTSCAIDLHDDIIDRSTRRGRRRTLLGRFGQDIALLCADALLFKGLTLLSEAVSSLSPAQAKAVFRVVVKLLFELGDGEALELRFRGRTDVTPDEYLRVVRKKAADVEAYTTIGALIGGGKREEVRALSRYGRLLGMMVILKDDLADMLDFRGEMLNRIRRESLPLPVLYALANPNVRESLAAILLKNNFGGGDTEAIFNLVDEAGGLDSFDRAMRSLAIRATRTLRKVRGDTMAFELIVKATLPAP
jgi:geranylgeranyl pyrophosphate synthase